MDALAADEVYVFEDFRLDLQVGCLFRAGEDGALAPVAIGSRALDILILLVARHGALVSKDEIMAAVWPEMIVEDSNLPTQILALRRVLDRGRSNGSCIQTVAGRGYRFVAAVTHPGVEPLDTLPIRPEAIADLPASNLPIAAPRKPSNILAAVALALVALVITIGGWRLWTAPKLSPAPELTVASSISQPLIAPRLSIVVLPFANLINDADQQYFADGMTDDLTTDLSRITDMFVIARNTAFTYRNKPVDAKQIGRELGVRYVLEGSVQRSGNQIRINAQLIDAETNSHLWAERFEQDMGDLFALQNEITTRIAVALKLELLDREAARPTISPDAQDYILRARAVYTKAISREIHAKGIGLFERALALDPNSAEAQSWLAAALAGRALANMTDSPAADIERASRLSAQAMAASPRSVVAHGARGEVLRAQRRYAEAIPEYETVLALDRNVVYAYFALGQCKLQTGSIEETIPLVERAIRLSPRDPALGVWYQNIGLAHLLQSRTEEAVMWLEKARDKNPEHSMIRADLAAAYGFAGQTERAAVELAEARRLSPTDRYASLARLRAVMNYGVPKIRALREATYFEGMRKAGMPEE